MEIQLKKMTIRALMERSFELFKNLPAVAYVDEPSLSYQALKEKVMHTACLLYQCGIRKKNKVAILGDNSPQWVISYLATTFMGAVAVPILPGFPDADTRHIIRSSGADAIFCSEKYTVRLEELKPSELHTIITLEDFSVLKERHTLGKARTAAAKPACKKVDVKKLQSKLTSPEPEDLAVIIYTSGTTGHSKGVMLTHHNIVFDVINSLKRFPLDCSDRFLSILPLSHTFEATGGLLCPLATGVSIHYMQDLPTPQKLLASMQSAKPTGVLTVPLVMDKIYRKKILPQLQNKKVVWQLYKVPLVRKKLNKIAGKKLIQSLGGKLRFFMFGGASLNQDVEIFLRDAGISYSTGYGMTETSPIMTINPFGKVKIGSCGQKIPGIELDTYQPDPKTGIGEIIVRGDIVMQGYYNNPAATKEVFLQDGWLRTGDLGFFDSEGYLYIRGRSKNVIIGPSGENIYPEIIEQKLLQNPYIQECVVFSQSGKLMAKVYLDYDAVDVKFATEKLNESEAEKVTLDLLESIRQELNESLPSFSTLNKIVEHPEPFEKTPTNKVKRFLYIPNGSPWTAS